MRFIVTVALTIALSGAAAAQYPTQPFPGTQPGQYGPLGQYGLGQPGYGFGSGPGFNPNNFMPNIFNPQTQPLSPYLNLNRGGDPAANYYYGVRPGTLGMGGRGFGGGPFLAGGGNRMLYFPQLAAAPDPTAEPPGQPGSGTVLPPAGHPVVYNNTMGFFPAPFGQAGGARPGLSGLGAARGGRR
jgi:hypothetical protein